MHELLLAYGLPKASITRLQKATQIANFIRYSNLQFGQISSACFFKNLS